MIRTTVRLDEDLFKNARKKAIDERKPFAEVVNDALAKHLGKTRKKAVPKNGGLEFLEELIKSGRKNPIKGAPRDLAQNLDKYLWNEYRNS